MLHNFASGGEKVWLGIAINIIHTLNYVVKVDEIYVK